MISSPVQWVKDLALPQMWHRSQLQLRFQSLAREFPYAMGAAKKKKKRRRRRKGRRRRIKEKESYRYKEQTGGCQRGEGEGEVKKRNR